jgi:hypothetical protein
MGFYRTQNVTKQVNVTFDLNKKNSYKDIKKVAFKDIVTSVRKSAFGAKIGGGDLIESKISYEILNIKADK